VFLELLAGMREKVTRFGYQPSAVSSQHDR
jgi:hypothetical protein